MSGPYTRAGREQAAREATPVLGQQPLSPLDPRVTMSVRDDSRAFDFNSTPYDIHQARRWIAALRERLSNIDSQTTVARITELEAQFAECAAMSQKWASAAGEADGRAEKMRDALKLIGQQSLGADWTPIQAFQFMRDTAREAFSSSQPTDGEVRNGL